VRKRLAVVTMETKTMKAIGVAKYGAVDNFESRDIPRPESPTGMDILIQEVFRDSIPPQ
jgi:hypothetical protein